MSRPSVVGVCGLLLALFGSGCASTTVHKDPGPLDKGLRFYRPKPYLLVTPIEQSKWGGAIGPDEMVEMKLEWLPDFGEEYSIRTRTGIGVNKTKITLQNGWQLTQLDVDTDAKFNENVTAIKDLIATVAPGGLFGLPKTTNKGADKLDDGMIKDDTRPYRAAVRATNVPIGYYESVIACGPDGRKQLYGWRYVGFAPFAGCPMTPSGADGCPCDPAQMYGLVFEKGVMTFKPLSILPGASDPGQIRRPIALEMEAAAPAKPDTTSGGIPSEDKLKAAVVKVMTDTLKLGTFKATQVKVNPPVGGKVKVVVTVSPSELTGLGKTAAKLREALNNLRGELGFPNAEKTIEIDVVEEAMQ